MVKTMLLTKSKMATLLTLAVGLIGTGAGIPDLPASEDKLNPNATPHG